MALGVGDAFIEVVIDMVISHRHIVDPEFSQRRQGTGQGEINEVLVLMRRDWCVGDRALEIDDRIVTGQE